MQLFRSIDSSSAAGLPHTQDALKMGLSAQKGKIVEFSIQAQMLRLCPAVTYSTVVSAANGERLQS